MKSARDFNALAFDPEKPADPHAKHFIPRHGARHKGMEVVFDPAAHKEWVTGFRKRKNERKTAGFKQLEAKAKKEMLEERTERRQKKKEELNLPDNYGVDDSESDDEKELKPTVTNKVEYKVNNATTTVITAALGFGDDTDEDEGDEAGDDKDDEDRPSKRARLHSGPFPTMDDAPDEEEETVEETIQLPSAYNAKDSKQVPEEAVKKVHPRDKAVSKATKSANALAALKLKRGGGRKQPGMGTGAKATKRKIANKQGKKK